MRGIMKALIITALIVLGCSMFCGIIIISIGFGAIFPQLDLISAPIVCGPRQLKYTQETTSYRRGESDTYTTNYCVDVEGKKEDVSGQVLLVAGVMYGLILFVIVMITILGFVIKNRISGGGTRRTVYPASAPRPTVIDPRSDPDVDERLRKLKELRDSDLITEQDFEKKKAEILKEL
jgi:hypothetical protein